MFPASVVTVLLIEKVPLLPVNDIPPEDQSYFEVVVACLEQLPAERVHPVGQEVHVVEVEEEQALQLK